MFQEDILEKANSFFEEQQAVTEDKNITSDEVVSMDVDTTSQILQTYNILVNVYATFIIREGELSSAEMHTDVGNNYGKLQSALNNFQNNLKKYC